MKSNKEYLIMGIKQDINKLRYEIKDVVFECSLDNKDQCQKIIQLFEELASLLLIIEELEKEE